MRRARHSGRPLSIFLLAVTLCAAALALPPKAEAVIHLGDPNMVSLTNGLVGYWPLDGQVTDWATGVTKDLSGQGNDGQLTNMSTSTAVVPGKIGQAMYFNGQNYVSNSTFTWPTTNKAITISYWFNTPYESNGSPFSVGASTTARIQAHVTFGGQIMWDYGNISGGGRQTLSFSDFNRWHHLVLESNGVDFQRIILDGAVTEQSTTITLPTQNLTGFEIGQWTATGVGTYHFVGAVDDVRIYNRMLSLTEVQQLYHLGQAKAAHSNTIISNGLVGYWPLDGNTINWTTNTFNDISGNGNNATSSTMSTSTAPASGKIGQALKFDGQPRFLIANQSSSLNVTGDISLAGWFKTSTTGVAVIIRKVQSYELFIDGTGGCSVGNGKVAVLFGTGTFWNCTADYTTGSAAAYNDGKWHHAVFTYSSSLDTGKMYVDGALSNTNASMTLGGNPLGTNGNPIYLAGDGDTSPMFYAPSGSLDDLRVYNRVLSATEVQQLYKAGGGGGANTIGHSNTIISNGLVGYWTLDGPSIDWHTNTVADMSGQGNTGSLVSMSTSSSPTPGKTGQALNFNGSTNYVSASSFSWAANSPVTVAFWVKTSGCVNGCSAFSVGNQGDPNRFQAHIPWTDNTLYFDYGSTVSGRITTDFSSYLNKWTHVVLTSDATSRMQIFINGSLASSTTAAMGVSALSGITIGVWPLGNSYHNGAMDDFRIYNRVLSDTEVKQLYTAGR